MARRVKYRVLFLCEVEADDEVAATYLAEDRVVVTNYDGSLALRWDERWPTRTRDLLALMVDGPVPQTQADDTDNDTDNDTDKEAPWNSRCS